MPEENKYTLLVNKKRISVTEEVYRAYYQLKEREAYLDKLSNKHDISFEECGEKGIQVDYVLSRSEQSMEDDIIGAATKQTNLMSVAPRRFNTSIAAIADVIPDIIIEKNF